MSKQLRMGQPEFCPWCGKCTVNTNPEFAYVCEDYPDKCAFFVTKQAQELHEFLSRAGDDGLGVPTAAQLDQMMFHLLDGADQDYLGNLRTEVARCMAT